jgi:hypothetical protein
VLKRALRKSHTGPEKIVSREIMDLARKREVLLGDVAYIRRMFIFPRHSLKMLLGSRTEE